MSCRNCGFVLEPQPQHTRSSDSLVSQILRGSRPLFDSDHALLSTEILELQSLSAAQLEGTQMCRCAVLKALENRKSIYAPIRRLPCDILIEIFDSVCDSWWQEADKDWRIRRQRDSLDISGPLWVLGRVCGLWMDALHSSPASWARKLVVQAPLSKSAPEILQTYLEHTGQHLLRLHVNFTAQMQCDIILPLLVQSCQRWMDIRITATKQHMRYFESISHFPALQVVNIQIVDNQNYHSDMCLRAPQLWRAMLRVHGSHQIKLPPRITYLSECITCPENMHRLSQLPDLRRCHLWMSLATATMETPAVTVARLTHLYVNCVAILKFLSAPLLSSLTIGSFPERSWTPTIQESITRFLHRSRCHLETLSVSDVIFTSATLSTVLSLEACSTISCLKLVLHPLITNNVVEALTSSSVLPNLHSLTLCISRHLEDEWTAILGMVRSRRDAGFLKLVEVQFRLREDYYLAEDIRVLGGGDFKTRVEEWDPPSENYISLWQMS